MTAGKGKKGTRGLPWLTRMHRGYLRTKASTGATAMSSPTATVVLLMAEGDCGLGRSRGLRGTVRELTVSKMVRSGSRREAGDDVFDEGSRRFRRGGGD